MSTQTTILLQEGSLYAEVIIPLALPTTYTWAIPVEFQHIVQIGVRAEVQLRNKKYAGIIKHIHQQKPTAFQPKAILNILDEEPIVNQQQLQLWNWISTYYMCTEGEVMQAAIPANLKLSSESIIVWSDDVSVDLNDGNLFSDEEYLVAQALEIKKELKLSEVQQILDVNHVYPVIKSLIEKKVCLVWESLQEKYKPKTETFITLNPAYTNEEALENLLNSWSKAPKQLDLLLAFLHFSKTQGDVIQSELLKKANASQAQLKGLLDKKVLQTEKRSIDRIQSLPPVVDIDFSLSPTQQNALAEIENIFTQKNVCLLHGVTGSGKTQVYIKLMEKYLHQNKQVLYMLPEIALTAQAIRRIQKHFGGYIAVYHSKFNANERVEIWRKVKTGEIKIILGARSSVFLPFSNLGLIIADEEHDASYKQQDPAPRYNARDAAVYYASLFNAKVLLGSATPSLESYYNTQNNKYGLVEINERFGNATLPQIELIDLKKVYAEQQVIANNQYTKPEKIALTSNLLNQIAITLQERKQVILFQNRRGYSPYMLCETCGWIPQCNHCDVTLTFHKAKNKLSCHYCGTTYPVIQTCAACGSHNFIQKNFGTEKLEELLAEQFNEARVTRMDYDTVKGKNEHDTIIKQFEQQRIQILVGTQMVVKGLDFEHVNLVGIVDADGILNFTDFRVNERAFQLMEQVSGRAGRTDSHGKVLIQVSNVHHPVLSFVKAHDYKQFYQFEISSRKAYFYPPFSRMLTIVLKHKDSLVAEQAANYLVGGLQKEFSQYIQGPAQPVISRIRNKYIWEVLIKLPKDAILVNHCKLAILQQTILIQQHSNYKSVDVSYDVDPL